MIHNIFSLQERNNYVRMEPEISKSVKETSINGLHKFLAFVLQIRLTASEYLLCHAAPLVSYFNICRHL